jgi:hypothetical protein
VALKLVHNTEDDFYKSCSQQDGWGNGHPAPSVTDPAGQVPRQWACVIRHLTLALCEKKMGWIGAVNIKRRIFESRVVALVEGGLLGFLTYSFYLLIKLEPVVPIKLLYFSYVSRCAHSDM